MQNWVLLHTLFLENEAQIDRNNYGTMLFMSKQVSLPKISLIRQKMKIGQNSIYALFARRPSIGYLGKVFTLTTVCSQVEGLEGGGLDSMFPLLFDENTASRTFLSEKYIKNWNYACY